MKITFVTAAAVAATIALASVAHAQSQNRGGGLGNGPTGPMPQSGVSTGFAGDVNSAGTYSGGLGEQHSAPSGGAVSQGQTQKSQNIGSDRQCTSYTQSYECCRALGISGCDYIYDRGKWAK
jgi:hypothetical protein